MKQLLIMIIIIFIQISTNNRIKTNSLLKILSKNKNKFYSKLLSRVTLHSKFQSRSTLYSKFQSRSTLHSKLLSKIKTYLNSKSKHRSSIKLKSKIKSKSKSKSSAQSKFKSEQKLKSKLNSKISARLLLKQPGIILRGWLKYLLITPSKEEQNFEDNPEYFRSQSTTPASELGKSDEIGPLDIPDPKSFFFVMTPTTINILSARRNMITQTIDVIDLNLVDKVKMDADKEGNLIYKGGIESMGVYDEGKCFQLLLKNGLKYIMCMSKYKLEQALEENVFRYYTAKMEEIKDPFKDEAKADRNFTIDMDTFDLKKYIRDQTKSNSNYEIQDLGDWSICDRVCGGGDQSKWRGCKPPMPGGFRCKKKPVKLKRACNTQPCSKGQSNSKIPVIDESWKYKQPSITLPVKLDARFVSHRYQQYEECKIKDEDLCILRQDLIYKLDVPKAPILPGRAVLNTNSFSFYDNSKYESLHRSISLQEIVTHEFPHDTNCFEVSSKNEPTDKLVLCGCPFAPNAGYTAENWLKAIDIFRYSCGGYAGGAVAITEKDKIELNIGNEVVEVSGSQVRDMAKGAAMEVEKDDSVKADEEEAKKLEDAINMVESITTDGIQNEFYKEQLVQDEQNLKAKKDLEKMDIAIQKETDKLKCLQTYIEREKNKAEKNRKKMVEKQDIQQLTDEVKNEVRNVKKTFHSHIDHLKAQTERIKMQKMKKLTELKYNITKLMVDQQTRGTRANCKLDKQDAQESYCNARFTLNWFENKHCRQKENFCGVCCDKEFSVTYAEDRERCIYECELVNGQVQSSNEKLHGSNYIAKVQYQI